LGKPSRTSALFTGGRCVNTNQNLAERRPAGLVQEFVELLYRIYSTSLSVTKSRERVFKTFFRWDAT